MRVRAVRASLVALLLAACGGRAPTGPTGAGAAPNLVAGPYTLTITMSMAGDRDCTGGVCVGVVLCVSTGGTPSTTSVSTPVTVERAGDTVTVRPQGGSETFRMDVQLSGATVNGTASGSYTDGRHTLSIGSGVFVTDPSPPVVSGTVLSATAAGKIDGMVWVDGYGRSTNGHTWVLTPR